MVTARSVIWTVTAVAGVAAYLWLGRRRTHPGRPVDGKPLSGPERRALKGIEHATRRRPAPDRLYRDRRQP